MFWGNATAKAQQKFDGALSFDVTDSRRVITRGITEDLLLRVVKESSVRQEHLGWTAEVVRKPYRRRSANLLYRRKLSGAHPSQVFAWHVGARLFPDERVLNVRGYPYQVRIALLTPRVEGEGKDRRFG